MAHLGPKPQGPVTCSLIIPLQCSPVSSHDRLAWCLGVILLVFVFLLCVKQSLSWRPWLTWKSLRLVGFVQILSLPLGTGVTSGRHCAWIGWICCLFKVSLYCLGSKLLGLKNPPALAPQVTKYTNSAASKCLEALNTLTNPCPPANFFSF